MHRRVCSTVGPTGRGTPELFGVRYRVDIVTGTLGTIPGVAREAQIKPPAIILVGIAWPVTKTVIAQKDTSAPDLTIKVTGNQWYWTYNYPDLGDFTVESRILPEADRLKRLCGSRLMCGHETDGSFIGRDGVCGSSGMSTAITIDHHEDHLPGTNVPVPHSLGRWNCYMSFAGRLIGPAVLWR